MKRFLDNFTYLRRKMDDINERDSIRNFQPPVDGHEIMETFGLRNSPLIGTIKQAIKDAVLDGLIPNEHDAAHDYMIDFARSIGVLPTSSTESTT